MGKILYSFTYAGQTIEIDLNEEHWKERWELFRSRRDVLGPVHNINQYMLEKEAVPKLLEIYDSQLINIYRKSKSIKEKIKFYSSFVNNLEKEKRKFKKLGKLNLIDEKCLDEYKIIKNKVEEVKNTYEKENKENPINTWILNFYHFLLVASKNEKSGKTLYKSRLQKRLSNNKMTILELATQNDPLLLELLEDVENPHMATDNIETKEFIAEFLNNFETCYKDFLYESRFQYDEDEDKGLSSISKKIQRIILNTYAKDSKDKFLENLGIVYDSITKKYDYK